MHDANLCYMIKDGKVLLGYKKRGFGEGRWNGYGGKLHPGETITSSLIRELKEEADLIVKENHLKKVAVIDFYFTNAPAGKDWDQTVHVYTAQDWEGTPIETEEMRPQWFDLDKVPINEMWVDDPEWLPLVLQGKKIRGEFTFGQDNSSILKRKVEIVDEFN